MRVNAYIAEEDASANYRVRWPAEAMIAQGLDVEVCKLGVETRDCDVVVFNRPVHELQGQCVEELVALGKRVIVDMDDWHGRIVPEHIAYRLAVDSDNNIQRACKAASLVTVTTPALLEPYSFGHGVVFPNYVPDWYLDVKRAVEHKAPWVQWTGTVSSHPTDLQTTKGKVAKAMEECSAELSYIGPKYQGQYVKDYLGWKGTTHLGGWYVDQRLYMGAMACADIGIVPLAGTMFNTAKSCLKAMEFASVGVAVVMAPTPDNVRLNKLGVGVLARHTNDWYYHVRNLLQNRDYREDVVERGREAMTKLTISQHASELHSRWLVG